jgi:transcriptional regulator with XRE-family HTH domain
VSNAVQVAGQLPPEGDQADQEAPVQWSREQLRAALNAQGLSQSQLAARLGIAQPQVAKWLSGARPIPPTHRARLAEVLDQLGAAVEVLDGQRLRELRTYLGWTPQHLAVLARGQNLPVSREAIGRWERGQRPVPARLREPLREVLLAGIGRRPLRQVLASPAAVEAGLTQAELARRLQVGAPRLNAWVQESKPMPLEVAARVGRVLVEVDADAAARLRTDVERLVELIAAGEPHGLTWHDVQRGLAAGRRRGHTGASTRDERALARAVIERRIHRRATAVPDRSGQRHVTSERWHAGPHPDTVASAWTARHLITRREAAGVSQSRLAREIGVTFGTVSKWERGERVISLNYDQVLEEALQRLQREHEQRPDPLTAVSTRLRQVLDDQPGLTQPQLFVSAGYSKRSRLAEMALAQLVDREQAHLRPTPDAGSGTGWHEGVHPGPAPARVPESMEGQVLRAQRTARQLTQQELAEQLGLTQGAVGLWERGAVPPLRVGEVLDLLEQIAPVDRLTGEELRRRRQQLGLRQQDLADRLGLSQVAITRWERVGVPVPRTNEVLAVLAAAPAPLPPAPPRLPGPALAAWRRAHEMRQRDLAELLSVRPSTLAAWETRRVPEGRVDEVLAVLDRHDPADA